MSKNVDASNLASLRWKGVSKKDRKDHAIKMSRARWKKDDVSHSDTFANKKDGLQANDSQNE